jgi:hypothetical protein
MTNEREYCPSDGAGVCPAALSDPNLRSDQPSATSHGRTAELRHRRRGDTSTADALAVGRDLALHEVIVAVEARLTQLDSIQAPASYDAALAVAEALAAPYAIALIYECEGWRKMLSRRGRRSVLPTDSAGCTKARHAATANALLEHIHDKRHENRFEE